MKRIISLLLCALMLVPAMAACSDSGADVPDDTAAGETTVPEETTPAVTDRSQAKDNLPEGLNFNGETIKIHTRGGGNRAMDVDGGGEETGDVVYDAVYAKARSVEERLGVKLEVSENTEGYKAIGTEIEATVLAGDNAWHMISTSSNATISFSRDYLFQPMQNSKYLDLDQPWWWKDAMYECSVDSKNVRYLIGDTNITAYNFSGGVLFNKKLFADFGGNEEELYKMVIDRKWTADKLAQYATQMHKDVDGDGKMSVTDINGYYMDTFEYIKFLVYGSDVRLYSRNDKGEPVIDVDMERANEVVDILIKLMHGTDGVYYDKAEKTRRQDVFANGNTVFYGGLLGDIYNATVRGMEDEYGLIPYPMMDDKQEEYNTFIHNSCAMFSVPITNPNTDSTSAVLEALCAESYRTVIDIYFETALKAKYSADSYSAQCVDIIRSVAKKYFFAEYAGASKNFGFELCYQVRDGANTLSSAIASKSAAASTALQTFIADLQSKTAANNTK